MPSKFSRSGTNFRGFFPSVKNQCQVPWHSLGEQAACLLLEFSPQVTRYRSCQDKQFEICGDGDAFGYTPDYEVILRDDEIQYVEIKPRRELRRPSVADRLARARSTLANLGCPLSIWDESITHAWPRHDTLKLLRPWRGRMTDADVLDTRERVAHVQPGTVRSLVHLARTEERALMWIANSAAGIDVDQPFTRDSEILVGQSEIQHAPIFA
ncbi:Tn7 transposase TnsA N-terminal domain-containing protein [Burkholderia cepacia]|uniref:Tn7 transposase TnsA N-terminal domain-containing protein n=1 Tax=Burkholderia cepacia TaxID=292 RepID=UPI000ACABABD|nr:Tn7 transposase TnsA N-terminal domain-containing protein [Burkholderia cepacia]